MEVLAYRLRGEYGVELLIASLPYSVARWLLGEEKYLSNVKGIDNGMLVLDKKGDPVVLANNAWNLNWLVERNPEITFLEAPNMRERI
jgi:peptide chain release factor 3